MCPVWNTTERGQNREDEDSYYGEQSDWDGKSCSDFHQLPGRGIRDVEDLTLLHGLALKESGESEDDQDDVPDGS